MSSAFPAGRRHARMPRLLRASQIVLIIGAVLCAVAAVGPVWAIRVGIGLAITTGVVAVVLAFKHLRQVRREHAAKLLAITKDHGAALTAERSRNAEVVQVLTDRARTATDRATRQQIRIGELNTKVTELTGDNARLRGQLKSRDVTIAGLRETIRSRDTKRSTCCVPILISKRSMRRTARSRACRVGSVVSRTAFRPRITCATQAMRPFWTCGQSRR